MHDPIATSMYQTKIAGQCRSITVTWCKNLLLHGLSVSIESPHKKESDYRCKVELKPWCFWRKHGSKQFVVDNRAARLVWDLRNAKFHGEAEPRSGYYVAIVCDGEAVLVLGDMKKDAYRRTACRPALIEPTLVSRREHVFGKKVFSTRVKLHEKGRAHEVSIGCSNIGGFEFDPEMEIRVDGKLAVQVKHLQWKFRGNERINVSHNKSRVEVLWDAHDWIFGCGSTRHALFIFKPISSSSSSSLSSSSLLGEEQQQNADGSNRFCLFFYAWRVE